MPRPSIRAFAGERDRHRACGRVHDQPLDPRQACGDLGVQRLGERRGHLRIERGSLVRADPRPATLVDEHARGRRRVAVEQVLGRGLAHRLGEPRRVGAGTGEPVDGAQQHARRVGQDLDRAAGIALCERKVAVPGQRRASSSPRATANASCAAGQRGCSCGCRRSPSRLNGS
jgi:hypothetical protein